MGGMCKILSKSLLNYLMIFDFWSGLSGFFFTPLRGSDAEERGEGPWGTNGGGLRTED
jgi:hypothetical protein